MPTQTIRVHEGQPLLDIASYGRRGPGRTDRLLPTQVEQIARTVRRVPEVMVKVSGGGKSAKAVAAHFSYIDRRGELEIETDDGEQLRGKGVEKDLVDRWDLISAAAESQSPYTGKPGRKAAKLVHNIVLSMPAGTPPNGLLAASRAFAREQFALKHRYAMVLHIDQGHPHVHLVVKATSEHGERLNIRKATLREWRREFATQLRRHGIDANATERAVRGESRTRKTDGIYRAALRGTSTHVRDRIEAIATELRGDELRPEPAQATLLKTRQEVETGWRAVSSILRREGEVELATQVERFADQMLPVRSDKQWLAAELVERTRESRKRELSRVR